MNEELKIVSTNEVMEFISILKELPSDVALEIIAQYPEFTKLVSDTLNNNTEIVNKVIHSNQQNAEQCFMFYQEILSDISRCLEDDELTYEQRMALIDKEIEIAQIIGQKELEIREMNRYLLNKER